MDIRKIVDPRRKSFAGIPAWLRTPFEAMRGINRPTPLVGDDGKLLGMLIDRGEGCDFAPAEQHGSPYNSYDHIISQLTADTPQRFTYIYEKNQNAAAVANSWNDMWPLSGSPSQGTYPGAARTAVQWDDTATGALPHGGNVSPKEKYLLSMMPWTTASASHCWLMYDRVLSYDACTMTAGSQSMTNTLTAQRYIGTGQPGLQLISTTQTVHNATAANLTVMNYTDNTGSAAAIPTTPTNVLIPSAAAGSSTVPARINCPTQATGNTILRSPYIPLQAGTTGMRSITDYTWSAAPTGTNCFVLMYPLLLMTDGVNNVFFQIMDTINSIGGPVRVYDGACLSFLMFKTTTTGGRMTAIGDMGWT